MKFLNIIDNEQIFIEAFNKSDYGKKTWDQALDMYLQYSGNKEDIALANDYILDNMWQWLKEKSTKEESESFFLTYENSIKEKIESLLY